MTEINPDDIARKIMKGHCFSEELFYIRKMGPETFIDMTMREFIAHLSEAGILDFSDLVMSGPNYIAGLGCYQQSTSVNQPCMDDRITGFFNDATIIMFPNDVHLIHTR